MALVRRTDVSPADWISGSQINWAQLVTFGPSGFAVYARLRFLRDPAYAGERASDAGRTQRATAASGGPCLGGESFGLAFI